MFVRLITNRNPKIFEEELAKCVRHLKNPEIQFSSCCEPHGTYWSALIIDRSEETTNEK